MGLEHRSHLRGLRRRPSTVACVHARTPRLRIPLGHAPPLPGHPMKKRRLLLLVGIGVVVAAGLTALLLCPAPTMINPGNAARVGEGMEFATVECLLGPPRDEFTGRLTTD